MSQKSVVADLLERHGTTYAAEAGIRLADEPSPLFQLLVLTQVSSARIGAAVAVAAARALFERGWVTAEKMRTSTWDQRVASLGSAGYRRYDFSTATALDKLATQVLKEYDGDLRRLRPGDHAGATRLEKAVRSFPRIGPTGAGIFCREVQDVWPEVAPYFDDRALRAAAELDLPTEPDRLAALAPAGRAAALAAALVRVGRRR
jgi:hypothetical protein